MKKVLFILLIAILTLGLMACGNSKQTNNDSGKVKIDSKDNSIKTKTNNKKETKIISGELYNKINSAEKVENISTIEDTEVGFTNLNISINVSKGTAMEELDAYTKKVAKIQTNLKDYFIQKKFVRITYTMYVDNEMKSVFIIYKKEDGKYILENTSILEEKYKKAADALK